MESLKFPNKGRLSLSRPMQQQEDGTFAPAENAEEERCPVTVKNTLPGQRIRFFVKKKRGGKAEGQLLSVLTPSPMERAEDVCPHFGICGGCAYQSLPYEEQLRLKEEQVRELLSPVVPSVDDVFEGIAGSPRDAAYRNKMEFTFGDEIKDGPLTLGLHKRGSLYDIVSVGSCRIVDEDYRKILAATEDYFRREAIPFYHRMRHEGFLRHLLVRKAVKTGEILVDLVTTTQPLADDLDAAALLAGWRDALLCLPLEGRIVGILHTKNDTLADTIKDEGTEVLFGQSFFFEELLGLTFQITPFSFFQTNSLGAEVLYDTARQFIRDALAERGESLQGKTLFDLYSGTGTIAQLLAAVADKVVGVEIVAEAVEAARENAAKNGLENCTFLAGDVLKVLDDIAEKPDFIVLDPPRDGIHPKALKKIIAYGVPQLLYISCKPTSLARDLAVLQESGYEVERVRCVDNFPQTFHTEVLALVSNRKC